MFANGLGRTNHSPALIKEVLLSSFTPLTLRLEPVRYYARLRINPLSGYVFCGTHRMPIEKNVQLGKRVKSVHPELVNLYGCSVGDDSRIGAFVEIQRGAEVGMRCKISSHSFICEGVTIEDDVF